jgi:hypothetical protein
MSDNRPPPPQSLPMPPLRWLRKPKKLLVLDLNGLLFWRVRKGEVDLASLPCAPDATVGQFHIFRRPNAQEFLTWCSQHFAIAVWSTAQAKNVQPMVDLAFAGLPPPMAILDQSHCTHAGEAHPDDISGTRRLMLKELSRLWSMGAWAAPFGPSNTLLVDDSPYKVVANPAHTAIHPTEWQGPTDPDPASHGALSPKGALRRVLAVVADAEDVRLAVGRLFAEEKAVEGFTRTSDCEILRSLRERRPAWRQSMASVGSSSVVMSTSPPPTTTTQPQPLDADLGAALMRMLGIRNTS